MNIEQYIRMFRKWLWVIVLAAVVCGAVGYVYSSRQPNEYRTTALINVGVAAILNPTPENSTAMAVQALTQTYSRLFSTFNVREATAESLEELNVSAGRVGRITNIRPIPETSLLTIEAIDSDPILAAEVANAMAHQFLMLDATVGGYDEVQTSQFDEINEELTALETQLVTARNLAYEQREAAQAAEGTDNERATRTDYNIVLQDMDSLQSDIHRQVNLIAGLKEDRNTLQIAETARVPRSPRPKNVFETTTIAAVIGAILSAGFILIYEFFKNAVETSYDVNNLTNLPVMGVVSRFGNRIRYMPIIGRLVRFVSPKRGVVNLITSNKLRPHIIEEYRTLRTNLLTKSIQNGEKVFLFTSPTASDGKSTTIANVAISIADANRKVLLVDGDMRQPQMHKFFDVQRGPGLMSLLSMDEETQYMTAKDVMSCVYETGVNGLYILPGGEGMRTPSETLDSENTRRFIEILKTELDFDVVLLDTPPCLIVSDSVAFTTFFDIEVIFVVRANKTRVPEINRAKERFHHLPENNISVILNGVDLSFEDYYSRLPGKYEVARVPQPST